jgi:hypothetical protein
VEHTPDRRSLRCGTYLELEVRVLTSDYCGFGFSIRGLVEFVPMTRFCAKEHRARVDGRATARHLHGKIERAARCLTVKISVESAGAVASNVFFESLTTRQSGRLTADSHNLMVVLAHLQGVAATFRVGRHHHRGPLCEGRGLTHALTGWRRSRLCGRNR